ncbi:BREX-3 system phosphatase PglZ [uncultured Thiohalocapsa sp.]|uniref:BREX-3 system phosphatase PglZ n=1 Tax=uncultured Thiohalocapsa sp. TaxID=768990 RepID=UPI0025F70AD7|nr:BREX-3 system phosphatase PglZ [uncultured Thiohalocapsa sp.]
MRNSSDDWRRQILDAFVPQLAPLLLVADPDGLLLEATLAEGIRARGFEVLDYEEPIAFRFAYERRYRRHAADSEPADLVVRLGEDVSRLERLPYDLLAVGKRLHFALAEVFPTLSAPVIADLDRGDLDALYRAQQHYKPGHLGENATREFVLRHVFAVAPELIKQPSDLLRVLLRRHRQGRRVPASLDQRLIEILRQPDGPFAAWPLERIVPDRDAFLLFLQERWPAFLDEVAAEAGQWAGDSQPEYHFQIPGPRDIPFGHDDVRVFVDNLFVDGLLQPVEHPKGGVLAGHWTHVGVRHDPVADRTERFARLLAALSTAIPDGVARHEDWMLFAQRWAELLALLLELGPGLPAEAQLQFRGTRAAVDDAFAAWLQRRYAGLHNQPAIPPVMLHQIPRAMARRDAFPETTPWPAWGLPAEYLPLVPKGRAAFVKAGKRTVCHGGIAIEEVMVPFVEIERGGA